jgi:hypothetical protein
MFHLSDLDWIDAHRTSGIATHEKTLSKCSMCSIWGVMNHSTERRLGTEACKIAYIYNCILLYTIPIFTRYVSSPYLGLMNIIAVKMPRITPKPMHLAML